jgi:hypothetical protein
MQNPQIIDDNTTNTHQTHRQLIEDNAATTTHRDNTTTATHQ